jgi:lauroyl/myristoyl acyltransferase
VGLDLLRALRDGEIVAVQGDRPVGKANLDVSLFGEPASLPTGPVQLAMATGAPILPVFTAQRGASRHELILRPPLRCRRVRGEGADAALAGAMAGIAEALEYVIRRNPEQWFNFRDVWSTREQSSMEHAEPRGSAHAAGEGE